MLRIKLAGVLLIALGALSALALFLVGRAETRILVEVEDSVRTGSEVVKLANRLDEYSLIMASTEASSLEPLVAAMRCPATAAELAQANREQTPAIDPTTLEPIVDAVGRPLDTDGNPMRPEGTPRCRATQHEGVLQALAAWSRGRRDAIQRNNQLFVADREPGFAIAREPDLLIASDADGVVVARVGPEMDGWFGPSRPNMASHSLVARAELGEVQTGTIIWREYDAAPAQLTQVAVAPILNEAGEFLGTILVGSFLTDVATDKLTLLGVGTDMAYFFLDGDGSPVFAGTSFGARGGFGGALQSTTFTRRDEGTLTSDTMPYSDFVKLGSLSAFEFEVQGERMIAVARPLAQDDTGSSVSGFFIVTSISEATTSLQAFRTAVPIAALLLFGLGSALFVVFLRTFLEPIEEISKGIQEVIAGNLDYMWPVDEDNHLSDLAHSLNVMSARLQGKPDPDDETGGGDSNWGGMVGGGAAPEARKPAGVVGLGNLRGRSKANPEDAAKSEE